MIEIVDTLPSIDVQSAEYQRLLGYPRDRALTDRATELAQSSRAWYARHGRPWLYAREAESLTIEGDGILIDGKTFKSKRLLKILQDADAHSAMLVAVSAGPEIELEAQRVWKEEKPDEYFFLEIFGSAVVEHLTTTMGARLCGWAENREMAVLPHYSPGYPDWDIAQQPQFLQLIKRTRSYPLPGGIESLDSGMLRPKKTLLAVFGLTRQVAKVRRLTDLVPCENCSYASCQYRRVAYRSKEEIVKSELPVIEEPSPPPLVPPRVEKPLTLDAKYTANPKALARWSDERLSLTFNDDGSIDALFKYEGTTCSNMGRAIHFHYNVKLSPRDEGYVIREQRCDPAPDDDGYTFMCRYMNNKEHLMVSIDHEKPLLGQPIDDVLTWNRPNVAAACYCEPGSRKHKWGIVLETIHYALARLESQRVQSKTVVE
jgi:hypothetical protein